MLSMRTNNINGVKEWLKNLRDQSGFNVSKITLSQSESWCLKNGFIEHKTGCFFKIIGIRWRNERGIVIEQPLVDQREIGTLGIVIKRGGGSTKALIQAKIEPGNVGVIQLSPTCQATESNTNCMHGGEKPPFSEYFNRGDKKIIYDLTHSEQGTRFYKKQNRNVLAVTRSDIPHSKYHKWIDMDLLFDLSKENYIVNTDARSVLISSPWDALVERRPFSRYKTGFGLELYKSANELDKKNY